MVQRAIYYASRLLSSQLNRGDEFSRLRPVYSIWICMHEVPAALQNTVCSFRMNGTNSDGLDIRDLTNQAQILNVDFMFVSEEYDWDKDDATVIKFLQAIFKNQLERTEFNPYIEPTTELRKEIGVLMTRDEELLQEREAGRAEGKEEGLEIGMRNLVTTLQELNAPIVIILTKLQKKYNLTLEQAQEHFDSYSKREKIGALKLSDEELLQARIANEARDAIRGFLGCGRTKEEIFSYLQTELNLTLEKSQIYYDDYMEELKEIMETEVILTREEEYLFERIDSFVKGCTRDFAESTAGLPIRFDLLENEILQFLQDRCNLTLEQAQKCFAKYPKFSEL